MHLCSLAILASAIILDRIRRQLEQRQPRQVDSKEFLLKYQANTASETLDPENVSKSAFTVDRRVVTRLMYYLRHLQGWSGRRAPNVSHNDSRWLIHDQPSSDVSASTGHDCDETFIPHWFEKCKKWYTKESFSSSTEPVNIIEYLYTFFATCMYTTCEAGDVRVLHF